MKVYSLPDTVPALVVNYSNFDRDKYFAQEAAHKETVKQELIALGYTGANTGRILRLQVADGYAQYMFADAGAKSCLMHLPYLDGYQYRGVEGMSKKWVLDEIARCERFDALFSAR